MNFDLIHSLNNFENVLLPYGNIKYKFLEKLYNISNVQSIIYKNIVCIDTLTTDMAMVITRPTNLISFQKLENINIIGIIHKKDNKQYFKGQYYSFEWDKPLPEMGEVINGHPRLGNVCIITIGMQNIHSFANMLYVAYNSGNLLLLASKKWRTIKNNKDKFILLIKKKYSKIDIAVLDSIYKSWIAYNLKISCEHFSTNNINTVTSVINILNQNEINYNMCIENINNLDIFDLYFKLWFPNNAYYSYCKDELKSNGKLYDNILTFMNKINL